MTDDERNLDLMVAELESENRLMRARNERLERELSAAADDRNQLKEALERILTVSRVALWDGSTKGTGEVGETKSVQRQATGLL
jgi:predicted RNase H-like nuclease (RuvC/YqgF family)